MPSFDTQRTDYDNAKLIRKLNKSIAVIRRKDPEVAFPTSLYGPDGQLIDLKAIGFKAVGKVSTDGYSFNREVSREAITSLGYYSPDRNDVTEVPRSIAFTANERGRLHMQELILGTDLSAVTQDPTSGEIVFHEPETPVDSDYELLVIASDGPTDENWLIGRGYPLVRVNNGGTETWSQEGAATTEITLDVFTDDETGVPVIHFMGGTGALRHSDDLGFTQAPVTP